MPRGGKIENMKHWRIITAGTLAAISLFAPLALFAAIDQYENPLCGHISSLPDFIKGILTIIVKVGVPVATIFIIWSGFLFFDRAGGRSQADESETLFCVGVHRYRRPSRRVDAFRRH